MCRLRRGARIREWDCGRGQLRPTFTSTNFFYNVIVRKVLDKTLKENIVQTLAFGIFREKRGSILGREEEEKKIQIKNSKYGK